MNFLPDNFFYFWFSISFLFLIAEMMHPGLFYFLSFFFGGMIAFTVSLFTRSIIIQSLVFLLGTIASLIFLRYVVLPLLVKERRQVETNIFALIGKEGFVLKKITSQSAGLVKIDGETWSARSVSQEIINEGLIVEIIDVRGAHVVVKCIASDNKFNSRSDH